MHVLRLVASRRCRWSWRASTSPTRRRPGTLLVEARTSAISAGTEIANFRDHAVPLGRAAGLAGSPVLPVTRWPGVVVGEGVTGLRAGRPRLRLGTARARLWSAARFARIPDGVSFDHAAMTTLTVIVMNAVRLARIELASGSVWSGPLIGQLALQLSRAAPGRPSPSTRSRRAGSWPVMRRDVRAGPSADDADDRLVSMTAPRTWTWSSRRPGRQRRSAPRCGVLPSAAG